jgi:transposase
LDGCVADIRDKSISYCVKDVSGRFLPKARFRQPGPAQRVDLACTMGGCDGSEDVAGRIYDLLLPCAAAVKVAHPLMLKAIAAAKKENDRFDASKICD